MLEKGAINQRVVKNPSQFLAHRRSDKKKISTLSRALEVTDLKNALLHFAM